MKKIIIALLIVAMSASVLSADPPQIIDFEILKIAGNSINYFFRYKLMNDSSVSVDLSDNDEIVIGNFQTDNKGVKAGSVLFDIMDCSNIVQAGNYKIIITVGGAKRDNGNTSSQVFANRKLTFPTPSGTDSSGVSWASSISYLDDSTNSWDIPVGTIDVTYPEIGLDRTSAPSKLT